MGRRFIVGDIHGGLLALEQCLLRCGFTDDDELITIGDIVDANPDSFDVVERLLKIRYRIDIVGNHDYWWHEFLKTGSHPVNFSNGAYETLQSYRKRCGRIDEDGIEYLDIPESHRKFFEWQIIKYRDEDKVFVHGGFYNFDSDVRHQITWDRSMWETAIKNRNEGRGVQEYYQQFSDIFIGHTSTTNYSIVDGMIVNRKDMPIEDRYIFEPITEPMHVGNVWNLDTGGGGGGKLTIMDVDTKEFWQSDPIYLLYPENTFGKI